MKFKTVISILLIALIIYPSKVWSQYSEMRGKVLNLENQEPIPFASISIKNMTIGTCSNSHGEFIFHYPDSLKGNDLAIQCIGYKTKQIPLITLTTNRISDVFLEPETYEIPEINIGPNPPTAADIVKKVIKNMHLNYPRKPYYMEGFLRDRCFNLMDNKNTRLTEAAVEIVKKEFGNENNADRVKVIEIRNSYNYSKLGSWWKEKIAKTFFGYSSDNPVYKTLQYKDFTDSKFLKELLKSDLYRTSISGYTMFNSKPVVIINIKEEYFEILFQKMHTNGIYNLTKLYIDTESYSILKTEFYQVLKFDKEIKIHFKQDTIAAFAIKQYENIEGQHYLKYSYYFGRMHDQPDIGDDKTLYFNETELLINRLITSRNEFDRIKHRDLLGKDTPLWDIKYVYDPSYCKNYNILIDKPLDSNVQKDLENEIPLDNQFIDAGIKNSKNQ